MKFKDLKIGEEFDFIKPNNVGYNSFFDRCRKVSDRRYISTYTGTELCVGSVNCKVYNVTPVVR